MKNTHTNAEAMDEMIKEYGKFPKSTKSDQYGMQMANGWKIMESFFEGTGDAFKRPP